MNSRPTGYATKHDPATAKAFAACHPKKPRKRFMVDVLDSEGNVLVTTTRSHDPGNCEVRVTQL